MTFRWLLVVLAVALLPLRGWAIATADASSTTAAAVHTTAASTDAEGTPPCHGHAAADVGAPAGDDEPPASDCDRCQTAAAPTGATRALAAPPAGWRAPPADGPPADGPAHALERPPRAA